MLEVGEIEELLSNDDHSNLFTASHLVALLLALVSERAKNKLASFCDKISLRFKDEADVMFGELAQNGDDDILRRVIAEVTDNWSRQLNQMCGVIAAHLARDKDRYELISLMLNITAALQRLSNVDQLLLHQLTQLLLLDLQEKQLLPSGDQSGLHGFLVCLSKFKSMDQQTYAQLLDAMKEHFVESTGCEECLVIFLEEAEHLPPPIADKLFSKAVLAFESQKSTNRLGRFFNDVSKFLGYGADSKTDNLTRLFSHCLREIRLDGLDTAGIIEAVSQQATIANMMRFYPQLAKLGRLEKREVRRADAILDAVAGFRIELLLGSLSLRTLWLLSDDVRVERLIALHECLTDVREPKQEFSTGELKALIRLRREELAAFHRAAENIKMFTGKFDVTEESKSIGTVMAQFTVDPARVVLKEVCRPREAIGQPIVVLLTGVSAEELAAVEQHNCLYDSAVFRIIHEEVCDDSEW